MHYFRELHRALEVLPECQKNKFPMHAIRNKLDESEDVTSDNACFGEILGRLERTLKDPKDNMFIEAYFDLID